MARVRLVHWNGPEGRERRQRLVALGHEVQFDDLDHPAIMKTLRADRPDVFLIDLSRLPSHGREVAMTLRSNRDTRPIPIVFVDGDPAKVAKIKALLPDATYTSWGRLKTALPKAIARKVAAPFVPPPSPYSDRTAAQKLGIKDGMRVCVLSAPPGAAKALGPLPRGVTLTAKPETGCEIFLVFLRSSRELLVHLQGLARHVTRQPVWLVWPKTASGVKTDLNGNVVRETGLACGWVDYKVCSIDATWSGLAFKRRH